MGLFFIRISCHAAGYRARISPIVQEATPVNYEHKMRTFQAVPWWEKTSVRSLDSRVPGN